MAKAQKPEADRAGCGVLHIFLFLVQSVAQPTGHLGTVEGKRWHW